MKLSHIGRSKRLNEPEASWTPTSAPADRKSMNWFSSLVSTMSSLSRTTDEKKIGTGGMSRRK